jgi:hypothetical protein
MSHPGRRRRDNPPFFADFVDRRSTDHVSQWELSLGGLCLRARRALPSPGRSWRARRSGGAHRRERGSMPRGRGESSADQDLGC